MDATPEQQFAKRTSEVRFPCDRLVVNPDGRLTEAPELLAEIGLLRRSWDKVSKGEATFGSIQAEAGAYVFTVEWSNAQSEMDTGTEAVPPFVHPLIRCRDRLQENLNSDTAATASELGLTDQLVRTGAQHMKVEGLCQGVFVRDEMLHSELRLNAASVDMFLALAKPPESSKPVDGLVTAAGPGAQGAARIEVNETTMYSVSGLSFDEAVELARRNAAVIGHAVTVDHRQVLKNFSFPVQATLLP